MTELKTLKDIDMSAGLYTADERVIIESLKEEAINWIKHLTNAEESYKNDPDHTRYELYYNAQLRWIKIFFNITDDDLK